MAGEGAAPTLVDADIEIEYDVPPEAAIIRAMRAKLCDQIDPVILMTVINCLTPADEQLITAKEKTEGQIRANIILLDVIVKRANFWNDLLQGLREENVKQAHLAEQLEEGLKAYQDKLKNAKKRPPPQSKLQPPVVQKTASTSTDSISTQPMRTKEPQIVYDREMNVVISELRLREIYTRHVEMTEKQPREYQKVLALPASQGHNTIICAPTGSGKTLAASLVCKAHLEKSIPVTKKIVLNPDDTTGPVETKLEIVEQATIPEPKILVLVPRNAILQHVYEELTGYLALWRVGCRRGNCPHKSPLHNMLKTHDVIVATADIFKNALLLEKTMKINDPTLIIFDECHHAMLDHSYNKIMSEYLKVKHSSPDVSLPQVVGLSASPGAGKTPNIESAQDWIMQLCANLDAEVFQTVPDDLQEELKCHMSKPEKSVHPTGTRPKDPFSDKVVEAMEQIERKIGLKRGPANPGSPEYQSLVTLAKQLAEEQLDDSGRRLTEHLLAYNDALLLVRVARFKDGFKQLKDFYDKIKEKQTIASEETADFLLTLFTDMEDSLQEIVDIESQFPNPKLTELHKLLCSRKQECDDKNQEFRVMVFLMTKALAKSLKEWMEGEEDLRVLNPDIFTGIRTGEGNGGMTEYQQNLVLNQFRTGEIKVLLSTSVGEEGVDIPACNMVVRYDHVKNEISMVQSRGRARASEAHEAIIGEKTTIEKDEYNIMMEEMMNFGITHVQQIPKDQFRRKMEQIQKETLHKRREKELERTLVQNSNRADQIMLKCKGTCSQVVCRASDIRVVKNTHYVNPDPEFREKIILKDHTNKVYVQKNIKKVHCKVCGQDWGNTSAKFPTLALKSFLVIIDGQGRTIKQWSKIPCTIDPLQEDLELPF